jgi:thioredoxin 1
MPKQALLDFHCPPGYHNSSYKERSMADAEKIIDINNDNFQSEVVGSPQPFLVDFSAEWCGPCKALEPVIIELADKYDGKVRVGRVDADQSPEILTQFQVRSIPTLLMFQGGSVVGQLMGNQPKSRIEDLIKKAL